MENQANGRASHALADGAFESASLTELASDVMPMSTRGRAIVAVAAIAIGIISFFLIGTWASSPETYADVVASLDAKRDTVMRLIGGSTGTSAAITVLPGDVGTPIAEKLLDIGADFAIVVGAIYLEKYLLTVLGFAAFKVLVPIACLMVALSALLAGRGLRYRAMLVQGASRLAVFGIALALVVPASVFVSDAIDSMYQESTSAALTAAEEASSSAAQALESSDASASSEGVDVLGFVQSIPSTVTSAAEDATTQAQETLNTFIETLAVMIVTSCVIPILVLIFFLWLAKTILGLNVSIPIQAFAPRTFRGIRR